MLPEDIIAKVRQDFPEDDAIAILQLLSELRKENPDTFFDRILRCIVFVAHGSFEKFAVAVGMARTDWRDLIVHAEYDGWCGEENRRRNFALPFTKNAA
jgi:hypothetical protein